ncbi:translation initiation factor IF-2 subunit beta [Candidatus Woesearchaeota archaeon]|nr:translation initiation factor IF-2 subunit beta [Candidatus Woesearchaeota archaeon]
MLPDYHQLLKAAKDVLPDTEKTEERFRVPNVKGHLQGAKTVISNLNQIADHLHRPIKHLLKYLARELATTTEQAKQLVILGSKLSASKINEKIQAYAEEFVICRECGKPDTKLNKEGDIYYFKCQACGARYTFTSKI